ncbi:uncharacterized protein UHOD_11636 [Ustilago sp. UG-2017b]|nr:uncharacterized protein UHOD_11636 [Ustilago sp. UG-2017b]
MGPPTPLLSAANPSTKVVLTSQSLWQHLHRFIQDEDPHADAPSAQTGSDHAAASGPAEESVQLIKEVLTTALVQYYPLRDPHTRAIKRFLDEVMAMLEGDTHRASPIHLRTTTPPPQSWPHLDDTSGRSPGRVKAYETSLTAEETNTAEWNELCKTVHEVIKIRSEMLKNEESKDEGKHLMLRNRIGEFLYYLGKSRSKFQSIYTHLHTASLEFKDCQASITDTVDRLIQSDVPATEGEAVSYIIYRLPVANSRHDRSEHNPELEDHYASQLRRIYHGDAPLRFLRFVLKVNEHFTNRDPLVSFDAYLKGTSIVQSSGTGKTRMVLELGGLAPLLYVCVRRKKLSESTSIANGYPLAEENLYEFFDNSTKNSEASYDLQVAVFLGAWFAELTSRLEKCITAEDKYTSLSQLNDFGGPGHRQRHPFFREVIAGARSKLDDALLRAENQPLGSQNVFAEHLDQAAHDLSRQLEPIQQHLYQRHSAFYKTHNITKMPVFVAFDECVELIVERTGSSDGEVSKDNQLNSLRRAWHHLLQLERETDHVSFWLVLLSTNTGAARLIEQKKGQASLRAREKDPLPVFVGLGFDVLRSEKRMLASPKEVCKAHQVCSYGRPLWDSLPRKVWWDIAVLKLLGAKKFDASDAVLCYNVLASRLALQLIPTHSGELYGQRKAMETASVDRHMRILREVVQHRDLKIDSPSEPALAVAAAIVMSATPEDQQKVPPTTRYAQLIDTFTKHCLPSLDTQCLKGSQGEFIARFVLMAAWDAAKLPALSVKGDKRYPAEVFSTPVDLQAYLKKLATLDEPDEVLLDHKLKEACNTVRDRLDAHRTAGISHDDPVKAWVNFTHFDALPEGISAISPDYLWYCWKRGVALQMAHGQAGVDGIIPVFVGGLSQRFRTSTSPEQAGADRTGMQSEADQIDGIDEGEAARQMTYIAWEAKFRDKSLGRKEASKAGLAGPPLLGAACDAAAQTPTKALTSCGLLTILADLGCERKFKESNSMRPFLEEISPVQDKSKFLRLWIRGLKEESTYPCLDDLRIRDKISALFQEVAHSAEYEEDNRMLLPLWNAGVHPEEQERVNEGQPAVVDWPSPYGPATEYDAVQPMELDPVQPITRASVEGRDHGFD